MKMRKTDCHIRTESSVLRTSARKEKDTRWKTVLAHHQIRNMFLEHVKNSCNSIIKGQPD